MTGQYIVRSRYTFSMRSISRAYRPENTHDNDSVMLQALRYVHGRLNTKDKHSFGPSGNVHCPDIHVAAHLGFYC